MKAPIQLHASRLTRSPNLSFSLPSAPSRSHWVSSANALFGRVEMLACLCAWVHPLVERDCSGLLSCGSRLALALLSVGSSGSLRSRPRWFGFGFGFSVSRFLGFTLPRILGYLATPIVGYSRQTRLLCEILHSPHCPDGRFLCPTDLGSDRRRRSLLQRLPASLPALLRISNVGLSVSVVVVVACLLLTLVAVCEFLFIFYSHTHTQTDTHTHAHAHAHYL